MMMINKVNFFTIPAFVFSFMTEKLGMKAERPAELNLPALFQLIPNSVKIMATSGIVCVKFILAVS